MCNRATEDWEANGVWFAPWIAWAVRLTQSAYLLSLVL